MLIKWISIWMDTNEPIELDVPVDEDATMSEKLERVFRACNHVDGSEIEVVGHDHPSMSCGDIVMIDDETFYCASAGWNLVTDHKALEAFLATPRQDRHCKAPEFDENGELAKKIAFDNNYRTMKAVV